MLIVESSDSSSPLFLIEEDDKRDCLSESENVDDDDDDGDIFHLFTICVREQNCFLESNVSEKWSGVEGVAARWVGGCTSLGSTKSRLSSFSFFLAKGYRLLLLYLQAWAGEWINSLMLQYAIID